MRKLDDSGVENYIVMSMFPLTKLCDLLEQIATQPASQSEWLRVCRLLDGIPDGSQLDTAAGLVEKYLQDWPECCRLPPDNWREDWENEKPQARLQLARGLSGLLPCEGGGSHPVQYDIKGPNNSVYYVRCRHGGLSIEDADNMDKVFYEDDIPKVFGDDIWLPKEANVLLFEICAAIIAGCPECPRFPQTVPELRSHPKYYIGIYPLYVSEDSAPLRSICNMPEELQRQILRFDRNQRRYDEEYRDLGLEPE